MSQRILHALDAVRFGADKATVTELSVTGSASIAVWGVRPGQEVPAHTHPDGQDTWVMLRGELTYYLGGGERRTIRAGDADVADKDQVHGAINTGSEDAVSSRSTPPQNSAGSALNPDRSGALASDPARGFAGYRAAAVYDLTDSVAGL